MLRMAWIYEELAAALDATDLWLDLDDGTRKAARSQVADGEYPFNLDLLDSWVVFADGEALAEGGVEEFLNELGPIVARAGVHLAVRRLIDPYGKMQADRYVVDINGEPCLIWRAEDWAYENVWAQATLRRLPASTSCWPRLDPRSACSRCMRAETRVWRTCSTPTWSRLLERVA